MGERTHARSTRHDLSVEAAVEAAIAAAPSGVVAAGRHLVEALAR